LEEINLEAYTGLGTGLGAEYVAVAAIHDIQGLGSDLSSRSYSKLYSTLLSSIFNIALTIIHVVQQSCAFYGIRPSGDAMELIIIF
jgi:hypothetical protein